MYPQHSDEWHSLDIFRAVELLSSTSQLKAASVLSLALIAEVKTKKKWHPPL